MSSDSTKCKSESSGTNLTCREFKSEWMEKYMFSVSDGKKPVCLICRFCVSVLKKYNSEHHYTSNHANLDVKYPAGTELRREFVVRKTNALSSQKAFLTKQNDLSRSLVVASYEMALLLAKKRSPLHMLQMERKF